MKASNPAVKRYTRRMAWAFAAYAAALLAANAIDHGYHPQGANLIALSILPALPIIAIIAIIGRYLVEERDEFVRQRVATSMLFGTGVLLATGTVHNFLSGSGAIDPMPRLWIFPLWCFSWAAAQCVLALRDRFARQPA
ncbi:hypothetical protein [Sphingomonas sp. 3-13AW]|jgi:hypothetical protein|uniref:hypothetical protein n=1 Tax=Sphingomonas sp. 3-13AW TaxID=3050450 RepID=UPI003BB63530